MKRDLMIVWLLIILSLPAVRDLFKPGAYTSHDLTHHIVRTIHMDKILSQGQFPPRWTDELNYGYGYPLFLFNYPLPSMIATGIHRLGADYIWSVKLTFALSMVLSSLFAYVLFAYLWRDRRAGFVSALFYLYAPIRFLNVYVSATFGNAVAFMFVPLIFYALVRGGRGEATKVATLAGAVSLAGLMLSHNIMALMFLPVIGLFFLLHPNRHSLFAIILGLGLASWFWLPATLEKQYLRYDTTLVGFYQTHWPTLKQLIRSPWGYGFSHPGTELDAMSFQIGLAHLLVIAVSLVLILKVKQKLLPGFWLTVLTISVLLMLQISDPIWKTIPWLSYLQMPWRLLAVSAFAAAALAGWVAVNLPHKIVAAGLLSLAVIIANRNHWRINQVFDPGEAYYLAINNTTTMASEHLPQGANKFDDFPPAAAKLEFLTGEGEVAYQKNTAIAVEAQITTATETLVRFNQIYFPGWRYWLDGRRAAVTVEPSRPLPQLAVAAGSHKFLAQFTRTPERRVADIISLISLAGGLYYAFRGTGYLQRGIKS
jgi:hypothetical protein